VSLQKLYGNGKEIQPRKGRLLLQETGGVVRNEMIKGKGAGETLASFLPIGGEPLYTDCLNTCSAAKSADKSTHCLNFHPSLGRSVLILPIASQRRRTMFSAQHR